MMDDQVGDLIKLNCADHRNRAYRLPDGSIGKALNPSTRWVYALTQNDGYVDVTLENLHTGHVFRTTPVEPCADAGEFGRRIDHAIERLDAAHAEWLARSMDKLRDQTPFT